MEIHAATSFEVLGEGAFGETVEGARGRGRQPRRRFHFSRMCPDGADHQLDDRTIELLAGAMTEGGSSSGDKRLRIPAGFTYLGQFIAHDMSFDETIGSAFGDDIPPERVSQGRSPALDLDSLYGAGPAAVRPRIYEADGIHLRLGSTVAPESGRFPALDDFDLPRVGRRDGEKRPAKTAVVADVRADENVALAQTHVAFIRFHNRVADGLGSVPAEHRFAAARDLVTKHYQWMIRHDFLPRICNEAVLDEVFGDAAGATEDATAVARTMPVEFAIGAFRLGHSMVRNAYDWNHARGPNMSLDALFRNSGRSGDLGGHDRLESTMIADFRRLYQLGSGFDAPRGGFNRAMRIDTRLANRVATLPHGAFGETKEPDRPIEKNLAFRNLIRARMVKLATGQDMVQFFRAQSVRITPLSRARLLDGDTGADLSALGPKRRDALAQNTPLWFYVLREAEHNHGRLTGVGARIVAITFRRAIRNSKRSMMRDPAWRPTLGRVAGEFDMTDLILIAYDHDVRQLAPLEPRRRR